MSIFMALGLLIAFGASRAQAQIVGEIEADIPFQFHAGNARFPAGKYILKMLDNSDLDAMEIRSADGNHAAIFQVMSAQAETSPSKTELIFNKYGNQYFLSKVFDEANKYGSEALESHYEKMVRKNGLKPEKHHVSARHHSHQMTHKK